VLETGRGQFLFRVTPEARGFLLREGTDLKYGARHLKRAIERHIVHPLANLLATEQVRLGDMLRIDWNPSISLLSFEREGEGAVVAPLHTVATGASAQAARAGGGRALDVPQPLTAREAQASSGTAQPLPTPAPSNRRKSES